MHNICKVEGLNPDHQQKQISKVTAPKKKVVKGLFNVNHRYLTSSCDSRELIVVPNSIFEIIYYLGEIWNVDVFIANY